MPSRADHASLLFRAGEVTRVPDGFAGTLAGHLLGQTAASGDVVPLPGWPAVVVESIEPENSTIGDGTELEIHVPPAPSQGPLSLAIVVDASLTMGEGSPSAYDRTASLLDAFLLSGRAFVNEVSVVLQGGTTRHVQEPVPPEGLSGALIHRVDPKGTFAIDDGIDRALQTLEDAEGPKAVLVLSDGDTAPDDVLDTAARSIRAGVALFAVTPNTPSELERACRMTGGRAQADPEHVFEGLADLAGARGEWIEPEDPQQPRVDPEFEVVIERVEEPAR